MNRERERERENKDWIGSKASTFVTMGASNHSKETRQEHDYYATEPKAMELLLDVEHFNNIVWECACGEGHLSKVLEKRGYNVISTDLIYRGYGDNEPLNFLEETLENFHGDIVTNPPYKYALQFAEKAIESVDEGNKVAMFLKLQFLEGKSRKKFFMNHPPKVVYVSSSRLNCAKNGNFEKYSSSAVAYAWFVWVKGFKGDPIIKWIN